MVVVVVGKWGPCNVRPSKSRSYILTPALPYHTSTTQVRTFYSSFYQTPVMPYFVRAGLRVALGVFLYKGGCVVVGC